MADNVLAELKRKMDRQRNVGTRGLTERQRAAAQADMQANQVIYDQSVNPDANYGAPAPTHLEDDPSIMQMWGGQQLTSPQGSGLDFGNRAPVMSAQPMAQQPSQQLLPGQYDFTQVQTNAAGPAIGAMNMNNQRLLGQEQDRRRQDAMLSQFNGDPMRQELMQALVQTRDPQQRRAIISQLRALQ